MVRRIHVFAALALQTVMFVAGAGPVDGSLQYWTTFLGTYPIQIAAPAAWEALAAVGVFDLLPAVLWVAATALAIGAIHYAQAVGMVLAGERLVDVVAR